MPFGSLGFDNIPLICGGYRVRENYDRNCYSFINGNWVESEALTEVRRYSASAPSPFELESHKLFVTGGWVNDSIINVDTSEIYTVNGWEPFKPLLPKTVFGHCMVAMNSFSTILIGGWQNSTPASGETLIFNSRSRDWSEGPSLNVGRRHHSCGRIRQSLDSHHFSIIVVGGYDRESLTSVEYFDSNAKEWQAGPELPYGIRMSTLIEDPTGGVILVGGYNDEQGYLKTLLRLSHLGDGADWKEMPQRLSAPRGENVAFLVSDEITQCTIL